MQRILLSCALAALAAPLSAQLTLVAPNGYDTVIGNSNNVFPFGRATASMRYQQVYDSSNFTLGGVAGPVVITGMRFRPYPGAVTSWGGGSWPNVRIDMASCPVDYTAASATFASNLDIDLQTVVNGPVSPSAGSTLGAGVLVPWHLDIPLSAPFTYDPTLGKDLTVDVWLDGTGWTGTTRALDAVSGVAARGTRIYNTAGLASPTGTVGANYALVCEFRYQPAAGYASAVGYGTGCVDRAAATFYELFGNGAFDLSNTSLQLLPTGNGYIALQGGNSWWTPVGANLGLTDDSVSAAQPLGFTLNYPGGSTSSVYVSSNGFVWAQSNTDNGCCAGDPAALRSGGARWCPLWNDLNPGAGGTVVFDQDLVNGAAYVTFTGVPEYGTSNQNTFQVAFFSSGAVELRWQSCSVLSHQVLTGWSPGGGQRDPGSVDISASLPIITQPDLVALAHAASARPVLGTSISLRTTNVPSGAPFGATLLGLIEITAGLPLDGIGMPGCRQYLNADSTLIWFPVGSTGSTPFSIPGSIAFAGLQIRSQSVALAPGINPLGAISSNGVRLTLDQN
jgi:hypothetical protein